MNWLLAGIYTGGSACVVITVILYLVYRQGGGALRRAFLFAAAACLGYAFFGMLSDLLVFMQSPWARSVLGFYGLSGMASGIGAVVLLHSLPPASPDGVKGGLRVATILAIAAAPLYFTEYWVGDVHVRDARVQAGWGSFYFIETAYILGLGLCGVALLYYKYRHAAVPFQRSWILRFAFTLAACLLGLILLTFILPWFDMGQFAITAATSLPPVALIVAYQTAYGENQIRLQASFDPDRSWAATFAALRASGLPAWRALLDPRRDFEPFLLRSELGARFWWLGYIFTCALGGLGMTIYYVGGGWTSFHGGYLLLQPVLIALGGNFIILTATQTIVHWSFLGKDSATRQVQSRALTIISMASMLLSFFYFFRLYLPVIFASGFLTLSILSLAYAGIRILPVVNRYIEPYKSLSGFGLIVVLQMGLFLLVDSIAAAIIRVLAHWGLVA
ncbi:MAG: hypothetical protein HS115_01265 [Spirochaetales bacterium]|nr:hypothetical protein [Spirochaetales bacterium]